MTMTIEHNDRRRRNSVWRVSPEWYLINTNISLKDVSAWTFVWVCHLHHCIHLAAGWHDVQGECLDNDKYHNVHLFSEDLCRRQFCTPFFGCSPPLCLVCVKITIIQCFPYDCLGEHSWNLNFGIHRAYSLPIWQMQTIFWYEACYARSCE